MTEQQRWRIHDPAGPNPNLFYVFTTENDARTAILALHMAGQKWELDEGSVIGAQTIALRNE